MLGFFILLFCRVLTVSGDVIITDAVQSTSAIAGTGLESACAGVQASFVITSRDDAGVIRTSGGDVFLVELSGTRPIIGSVLDGLNGYYPVTYVATKSGNYDVAIFLLSSGGLAASYFENVWFFFTPVITTVDPQINFNWGYGNVTGAASDFVSVRWQGKLKTEYDEVYTFYATTDDGAKLWVNDVSLIDQWDSICNDTSATLALKANLYYNIKMEYKEVQNVSYASLSWSSASTPKQIIPAAQLFFETHISNSPFSVVVAPNIVCGPRCTATGSGLTVATAGIAAQATIQANDAYDNARGQGEDTFAVMVYPPSTSTHTRPVHGTVVDNSDSTYSIEYTAYIAGINTLRALLMVVGGITATFYQDAFANDLDQEVQTFNRPFAATSLKDLEWGVVSFSDAFGPKGQPNPWLARWVGFLKPTMEGTHSFTTVFAANERVRLWIDNLLLIDQWDSLTRTTGGNRPEYTGTIDLLPSFYYDLKLEFYSMPANNNKSNFISLYWQDPSGSQATEMTSDYMYTGYDIMGSPFSVLVRPAKTCSTLSTAIDAGGSLSLATAGLQAEFTILARDAYGNPRGIGGDYFRVRLTGPDTNAGLVLDQGDGTYIVKYTPTTSGQYDLAIVFGASQISASPYLLLVMPARRYLPACVVSGDGITLVTAGVSASVTLTSRDYYDNLQPASDWGDPVTTPGIYFSIAGKNVTSDPVTCKVKSDCPDQISSLVRLRYMAYTKGKYLLILQGQLNEGSVKGSPYPLIVIPNVPCSTTSTVHGQPLTLTTAGVTSPFLLRCRDAYGNERGAQPGYSFSSLLRQFPKVLGNSDDKRDKVATVVDNRDNTFTLTYVATKATTNPLWASLGVQGGLFATYYNASTSIPFMSLLHETNTLNWVSSTSTLIDFRVRWSGLISFPYAETYTVSATAPANGQSLDVFIDNKHLISKVGVEVTQGTIAFLKGNGHYDIVLDYACLSPTCTPNNRGLTLRWLSTSITPSTVITPDHLSYQSHISGSPFQVIVKPNRACATKSTISQSAVSLSTAGVTATFLVQSKDAFGNNREIAGDSWDFALLQDSDLEANLAATTEEASSQDGGVLVVQATSTYLTNGQYIISYTPIKQGNFQLRGKIRQPGGLYGTYFEGRDLKDNGQGYGSEFESKDLPFSRVDPTIDFNWGLLGPVLDSEMTVFKKIGPDFFSVRWTGMIVPEYSDTWTFSVEVDDGAKLWVNGVLVIDLWGVDQFDVPDAVRQAAIDDHTTMTVFSRCTEIDGKIALQKDTYYLVELVYREAMGNSSIRLSWASTFQPKQVVPSSRLFVDITSKSLSRSGLPLVVYPAVSCASQSSALGPGLTIATVGASSSFTVFSRDEYGNPRRLGDYPLFHSKIIPSVEGQQISLIPSAVTRLSGSDYFGGLTGTYYINSTKIITCHSETWSSEPGVDPQCDLGPWGQDFSFGAGRAPDFLKMNMPYTVRWLGFVKPTSASLYTFTITSDPSSAARLMVNGQTTAAFGSGQQTVGVRFPVADEMYDIEATFYASSLANDTSLKLEWGIDQSTSILPSTRLYPLAGRYRVDYTPTVKGLYGVHVGIAHPGGLDATYYEDGSLLSIRKTRIDSQVNFNMSSDTLYTTGRTSLNAPLESISARWKGMVKPISTVDSIFTFFAVLLNSPGNGERVRLWVDNSLVIDRWDSHGAIAATMASGTMLIRSSTLDTYAELKLEYKQLYSASQGQIQLQWQAAGSGGQALIPTSNLFRMRHIAGSPFPPRFVPPAVTCASVSTERGDSLSLATAGYQATFLIQTKDKYSNDRGVGGDLLYIRLFRSNCPTGCPPLVVGSVIDNGDSTYTGVFNATRVGLYFVSSSLAHLGGLSATYYTESSSFTTSIFQSTSPMYPTSGNVTQLAGVSRQQPIRIRYQGFVSPPTAGLYTFSMLTNDAASEGLDLWVQNVQVYTDWTSLASTSETATVVLSSANSIYDITLDYRSTSSNSSNMISLLWKGPAMISSSLIPTSRLWSRDDIASGIVPTLYVQPELTDGQACTVSGPGLSTATAGIQASLTITSKDSFSNLRTVDSDSYLVRLLQDETLLGTTSMTYVGGSLSGLGQYAVNYTVTASGEYSIVIALPFQGGLKVDYFNNMWLLGDPGDSGIDTTINSNWGTGQISPKTPGKNITTGSDYMSVRWIGYLKPAVTEVYTMQTVTDDGVRLYVDGALMIDKFDASNSANFTTTFSAVANRLYELRMEYKEVTQIAYAKLYYTSTSVPWSLIPSSRLYYNAIHVFGSPFLLYVDPAATCATTTYLSGPGLSFTTAGLRSQFTIIAKDQYYNTKTKWDPAGDFFVVRSTPVAAIGSSSTPLMAAIKRGTVRNLVTKGRYGVEYTATMAGLTNIIVTLGAQGGLTATYYNEADQAPIDFSQRYKVAVENIDFSNTLSHSTNCPSGTCNPFFGVRWEGFYQPPVAGTGLSFTFSVNDGSERVRMWVDNSLVINEWTSLSSLTPSGAFSFPIANALYDLKIEYVEYVLVRGGTASASNKAQLRVNGTIVGTDRLFAVGKPVARSPYVMIAHPDVTSHPNSNIFGSSITLATAGLQHQFTIASRDLSGNFRDRGGDAYLVYAVKDPWLSVNGAVFNGTVTDLHDGQYVVRYIPSEQGDYHLNIYFGSQLQTFDLYVQPAEACASRCVSNGISLTIATAGISSTFTVYARDQYRNGRTVGGNEWIARLVQGGEEHNRAAVYAGQNNPLLLLGKYTVSYRTTKSGAFSLAIKLLTSRGLTAAFFNDQIFGKSVYNETQYEISPQFCNWNTSTLNEVLGVSSNFSVRWTGFVKSQSLATYTFQTVVGSSSERVRLWIDDRWVVSAWSSLTGTLVSGTIGLVGNTLYDLKMEYVEATGGSSVSLWWDYGSGLRYVPQTNLFSSDLHISGSPFTITVYPHLTCGATSTAVGAGLSVSTSGAQAVFTIQARDMMGNTVTTSTDTFAIRVRHSSDPTMRDLHGTVTALGENSGRYSVAYVANKKQNKFGPSAGSTQGGPYHDVLVSLAVHSQNLFATFYNDIESQSRASNIATDFSYPPLSVSDLSASPFNIASPSTLFGVKFHGLIMPPYGKSALYTFSVASNGSPCENLRLFLDNRLVLDRWTSPPLSSEESVSGIQFDVANGLYDLRLDYKGTNCGNGHVFSARVSWETETGAMGKQTLPASRLLQPQDINLQTYIPGGLTATYFQDDGLSSRVDLWTANPTVDWSSTITVDRPYPNCQADQQFSVRWYGFVKPSRQDLYTFYTQIFGTTSERVRLKVDTTWVIDQWNSPPSGTEPSGTYWFLRANDYFPIEMHYKSTDTSPGSLLFRLKWENRGTQLAARGVTAPTSDQVSKGVIRSDRLFQRMAGADIQRQDQATWFNSVINNECAWCQCQTDSDCLGSAACAAVSECRGLGYRVNGPAKVDLHPAASCAALCTTNGNPLTILTVGVVGTFAITVRDFYGNIRDSATDALIGRATIDKTRSLSMVSFSSTPILTNNRDPLGRYQGTYLITRAGSYQLDIGLTDNHGHGLMASYFKYENFTGPVVNTVDPQISFDWSTGPPVGGGSSIGIDNFSVRWTGYIRPLVGGLYTFSVWSDEGCRLWLKGLSLVDAWAGSESIGVELQGTVALDANVLYDIELEYGDVSGGLAFVELRYQTATLPKSVVPKEILFPVKDTFGKGVTTLAIFEEVICATTSSVHGVALTISTAGVARTFIVVARDRYGNRRTNADPFSTEYRIFTRIIPVDAATNLAAVTQKGTVVAGPPRSGIQIASYVGTRAGTHNLYTSIATGVLTISGLQATYYDDVLLRTPLLSRNDEDIDFTTTGNTAPACLADDGAFSIRWAGLVVGVDTAGYTFTVTLNSADERVQLWFDNFLIINQWSSLSSTAPTGIYSRPSLAGTFFDLKMQYQSTAGDASGSQATLSWQHDSNFNVDTVIPSVSLYNANTVSNLPTSLKVFPAGACATTSSVRGAGLTVTTAGLTASFTITIRDAFQNVRGVGADLVTNRVFSTSTGAPHNPALIGSCPSCPPIIRCVTTDNGDATYSVVYVATRKGQYAVVTSLLVKGGLAATYWDSIVPEPDAAITPGVVGGPTSTTVTETINFSNNAGSWLQGLTDEVFAARWVGMIRPSKASLYTFFASTSVAGNEKVKLWIDNSVVIDQWASSSPLGEVSGTYSFGSADEFYDITVAYRHETAAVASKLILMWQSTDTDDSRTDVAKGVVRSDRLFMRYDIATRYFFTNPTAGCASRSSAFLAATSIATAGVPSSFTILGRDLYSNDRDTNSDMQFFVDLYGSGSTPVLPAAIVTGPANVYTASYTATQAKRYELFVKFKNENILGSPFTLYVKPSTVCGSLSTATGDGLSVSFSSSISTVTIQARDSWGNAKTTPAEGTSEDSFLIRVVRTVPPASPLPELSHSSRAAVTIHAQKRAATLSDGKYRFAWAQDTDVSFAHWEHASWAARGGLMATYYSGVYGAIVGGFNTASPVHIKASSSLVPTPNFYFPSPNSFGLSSTLIATTDCRAVRFSGFIRPSLAGTYNFQVTHANSQIRLFIDNLKLIDVWALPADGVTRSTLFTFPVADDFYDFTLEYQQYAAVLSDDDLQFSFDSSGGSSFQVWPSERFFLKFDIQSSPWLVLPNL